MMYDIERLFPSRRISSIVTGILVFVYIPIGICLAFLRLCLLLNFFIAGRIVSLVFPGNSGIIEIVNRIFMMILGISIKIDGKPLPCNIITSNQRSHIDGIVLSHAMKVYCEDEWRLHPNFCSVLKLVKKEKIFEDSNSAAGKTKPIIVFPEGSPTSGTGIMKFQSSYFSQVRTVQSSSLRAYRVFSISLSTIGSGFWSDLFWTFFCPMTFYSIVLSEKCISRDEMEPSEFADAAALEVANLLHIPTLEVTLHDKSEYLKKLKFEGIKKCPNFPPRLLEMASRVQEVTPHVPRDVILRDLNKTDSVDVTITNILEGIVEFTAIHPKAKKSESRKLDPPSPRDLLERRKTEMYEMARKRFKEKHRL